MKTFNSVIFSLLFLFSGISNSYACSCTTPPPPSEALAHADAVFAGEVISIERTNNYMKVKFRIIDTWKPIDSLSIELSVGFTSCDLFFEVGQEFLIYANRHKDGYFTTNLCTRSTLLENAQADLDEIGDGFITSGCINPEKLNPHQPCTMEYNPVCGCDGRTYGNPCSAYIHGITDFTMGECGGIGK